MNGRKLKGGRDVYVAGTAVLDGRTSGICKKASHIVFAPHTGRKHLSGYERFAEGRFNCAGKYVWPGMPEEAKR